MIFVTKRTKERFLLQNPRSIWQRTPESNSTRRKHFTVLRKPSTVLEMSRLRARSKSQYFANEEKLISRKERGGFSRERVVE